MENSVHCFFEQSGTFKKSLKRYFKLLNGYEIEKVFDKNYGLVNAYHIDVWNEVYNLEL